MGIVLNLISLILIVVGAVIGSKLIRIEWLGYTVGAVSVFLILGMGYGMRAEQERQ